MLFSPLTSELLLLFQACLLPRRAAFDAWRAYTKSVDVQQVDALSSSFFPMVYANLQESTTQTLQICKSVYRHTWCKNQRLLHLIPHLKALGISPVLLKGGAMITKYYASFGARILGDLDIYVPPEEAVESIHRLRAHGWRSTDFIRKGDLSAYTTRSHALQFQNAQGMCLDLHWHLFHNAPIDPLFRTFKPTIIDGELSAEDLLLHTLYHGVSESPIPLIRWIPDSITLLRNSPDFSWETFLQKVAQLQLTGCIAPALGLLNTLFIPLPKVSQALQPSPRETAFARYHMGKKNPSLNRFLQYYHAYRRSEHRSFLRYFMEVRSLPDTRALYAFLRERAAVSSSH